jgi:hypothetical protein
LQFTTGKNAKREAIVAYKSFKHHQPCCGTEPKDMRFLCGNAEEEQQQQEMLVASSQ